MNAFVPHLIALDIDGTTIDHGGRMTEAVRDAVRAVADAAYKQCHPMPNIPGDEDWRREMVPVYVRRTLTAAARRDGPVHHV